ncbi:MAG TPA: esterase-like activity of phytase family protein [Pseudolabrys sp.]|jgi:hypothetical protein
MATHRRWLNVGALCVALALVAGSLALANVLRYPAAPTRIEVTATPITSFDNRDPTRTRFGDLEFRGGLELSSRHPAFGGISSLHVEPDGNRFIAATDRGSWVRGRIIYRDGRPVGIADAEVAPIFDADGRPLAAHGWYDVESLTERDGNLYIGIERAEQIVRFDYRRDGLRARGQPIDVPADFKTFTYNKSLECLAAPRQGTLAGGLIVVTEHSLDSAGNLRSFVLGPDRMTRFSIKRSDDFDASDCTLLSQDELLLLERRYSPARGIAVRIRRVPLAGIKEGALVDGRSMFEADLAYQIDNMEGIGVHRNSTGETIVTLVSDDNFSIIQRNLLLQFSIVGE